LSEESVGLGLQGFRRSGLRQIHAGQAPDIWI
jgi:hypothetical protein